MTRIARLATTALLFGCLAPAAVQAQTLYWIDNGSIVQFDVATTATTPVPSATPANTITVDPAVGKLFYFQNPFSLMSADLDGSNAVELTTYPFGFEAMVANFVNQRVYWLNTFNGQIVSVLYDGTDPQVLGGQFGLSGIGIDTVNAKMYHTHDGVGAIVRQNFDASMDELVLAPGPLDFPQDCRFDSVNAKVYWHDNGDVERCNTDGSNYETIVTTAQVPGITNVVIDGNLGSVYMSTSSGQVWSADLDGSNLTMVYGTGTNITEMAIIPGTVSTDPEFVRGDVNQDGGFDIGDPVAVLNILFVAGTPSPDCEDSTDINDDGQIDISDAVTALSALFVAGSPPPPEPSTCGVDPTDDMLGCDAFVPCP